MKTIATFAFLFVLCLNAAAQDAPKAETKKALRAKKADVKPTPLPADGKDPVCFMKVKKGSVITTSYNNKLYGFCSEHCKAIFLADPAAQLK